MRSSSWKTTAKQGKFSAYYKEIDGRNGVHVVYWDREFNYSAINNFGVGKASGEYLVFLNNDVEIISENWLEELLGHCQRERRALLEQDFTIRTIRSSMPGL